VKDVRCFIPSKGRPQTRTHLMFAEVGIPVTHIVEPQDEADYRAEGLHVVTLPDNNRGLPFSRNFTLDEATRQGVTVAFMCDDDVNVFGRTVEKKGRRDHSVLKEVVEVARKNPRTIVGMEYQQYSWAHRKPYVINNGWVDVCIAFQPAFVTARYTDALELKEDRDWQLENIGRGIDLIRLNHIYFGCPDVGTNAGGLQTKYQQKLDHRASQLMVMKWTPYLELVKKDTRLDCKANWPLIRKRLRGSRT
jgi:hypothetical protein